MSDTTEVKPVRISVSIAPHVLEMFDGLAERNGLDRPGMLAVMIQTFHYNPALPWKQADPKQDDGNPG